MKKIKIDKKKFILKLLENFSRSSNAHIKGVIAPTSIAWQPTANR